MVGGAALGQPACRRCLGAPHRADWSVGQKHEPGPFAWWDSVGSDRNPGGLLPVERGAAGAVVDAEFARDLPGGGPRMTPSVQWLAAA